MQYKLHVKVTTKEQFDTVIKETSCISRIYVLPSLASLLDKGMHIPEGIELYLCSPFILRDPDVVSMEKLIKNRRYDGFLCSDHEFFGYINDCSLTDDDQMLVLDNSMYILNDDALDLYVKNSKLDISGFYNSFELNYKELLDLKEAICKRGFDNVISSYVVYGRIPMMISANCVNKTSDECNGKTGFTLIKDRMGKSFPVYRDCGSCINVIYNSVPLSLHKHFSNLCERGDARIDLTNESSEETKSIIDYFSNYDKNTAPPYRDYTTGHYKRGVE